MVLLLGHGRGACEDVREEDANTEVELCSAGEDVREDDSETRVELSSNESSITSTGSTILLFHVTDGNQHLIACQLKIKRCPLVASLSGMVVVPLKG